MPGAQLNVNPARAITWLVDVTTEVESRVQLKRLEAKDTKKNPRPRTDRLETGQTEGRPSRGQGQECSRPRTKDTSASVLKKERSSKIFSGDLQKKKGLHKNFAGDLHKILTFQKVVLSSSRGQGNFRGLEASRPRPRISKCVLEDSTSALNNIRTLFLITKTSLIINHTLFFLKEQYQFYKNMKLSFAQNLNRNLDQS